MQRARCQRARRCLRKHCVQALLCAHSRRAVPSALIGKKLSGSGEATALGVHAWLAGSCSRDYTAWYASDPAQPASSISSNGWERLSAFALKSVSEESAKTRGCGKSRRLCGGSKPALPRTEFQNNLSCRLLTYCRARHLMATFASSLSLQRALVHRSDDLPSLASFRSCPVSPPPVWQKPCRHASANCSFRVSSAACLCLVNRPAHPLTCWRTPQALT
eukprot:5427993-Pleurochrysis_carterae.AAC.4